MMFSGKMLIETSTPTEDILFLDITLSQRLIARKKKKKGEKLWLSFVYLNLKTICVIFCFLACLPVCFVLFCFVFSINLEFITF